MALMVLPAYNLGNFLRTLATPEPIKDWSLTSLTEKLIKIGAKVVSHGRYVAFQMAEVAIGSVQNLSHFRLAERRPALAHAVMAPLICWSFSNSMFRYLLVDHAVPAM